MEIIALYAGHPLWESAKEYVNQCSWAGGRSLYQKMCSNSFQNWERVLFAREDQEFLGFCTVVENDNMKDLTYSPFIGYVFVDEKARGKRLSEQMIRVGESYLKELGYDHVSIMSDHVGLYEKFGYTPVARARDYKDREETVFQKQL